MTTWREIENELFHWAEDSTGVSIVWAKQPDMDNDISAPAPEPPYCVLQFITGPTRRGNDDEIRGPAVDRQSEMFRINGQRVFSVQMSAIGDNAKDLIEAARMYFERPTIGGKIQTPGKRVVRVSTVTPLVDYTNKIDGEPITITSGTSPTAKTIRDAIVAAINAFPFIHIRAESDESDTAVFTIISNPGFQFFFDPDDKLTLEQTEGAVDIVYLGENGIIEGGELFDAVWESKSINEFRFGTLTIMGDEPGVIREVEITDEITNETFIVKGD